MAAESRTVTGAAQAVGICVALSLPAAIALGRSALAIGLGLAAIALVVAIAGGMRWRVWTQGTRLATILAAILGVFWLPSVFNSLIPSASALTLLRVAGFVAGAGVFVTFLSKDETFHRERVFLVAMLAALSFACLALFVDNELLLFRTRGEPLAAIILKSSASAVACAIPVTVYIGWRLGKFWRAVVAVNVLLSLAYIWGTGSKSSLAGLLVALLVTALVACRRLTSLRVIAAATLVVAALGSAALLSLAPQTPRGTIGGYHLFVPPKVIDAHRQVIWQFTLDRFAERPWFGWGPNVSNYIPGAEQPIPELQAEYIPAHPHNWMIEILTECGVIGFVPLLAIILGVAVAGARAYWRTLDPAWLTWLVLWLTYWSAGSFNFSTWNTSWQGSGLILAILVLSRLPVRSVP